ncbi:adenylate/guanylate cyclase domain-containing protein [Oceanibacterium hippocampi]|uniref:Adenylate cyclase 1 n=1 Tax=Oceanibacterium hippocampi TaxID=745714 RepID=A0A1Y5SA87_9PROT|nr:adenylate/guanylate cyclase domain-containing protein [Oceanibacterium hippocampi]SLN33132.1 Adenylate cyclase 1 [Oceanibacterium hippocampi]
MTAFEQDDGNRRLDAAFRREQRNSVRRAAHIRLAGILVIGIWVMFDNGLPAGLFYLPFLAVFGIIGYVVRFLFSRGYDREWVLGLVPLVDGLAMLAVAFADNPFRVENWPAQLHFSFGVNLYFFLLICGSIFYFTPRVVLWTGAVSAILWSATVVFVQMLPSSPPLITSEQWASYTVGEKIALVGDPYRINLSVAVTTIILYLLTSAILALFVHRTRGLVYRHAATERERTNLARYFSANLVDELANSDQPLTTARTQEVAVMFVDIRNFTRLSETLDSAALIALLREFYARLSAILFAHDGTLEKFTGDGLMATFGTPQPGPNDATNALRTAIAMREELGRWNEERAARGTQPVEAGIGIHYGPVVVGDIGDENRLELAVLGDTVNVANRIERMTRELDHDVLASDALVRRVKTEGGGNDDLTPGGKHAIRGREDPVMLWGIRRAGRQSG